MNVTVKFAKCYPDAVIPFFAHEGDSGFDLYTVEPVMIESNRRAVLKTGLRPMLPPGYEIQIRPRSGISANTDLTVLLGTVDSGYRGEIGVIVHNNSKGEVSIKKGERIGQGVIVKLPTVTLVEIAESELTDTSRGNGGFGSTGLKHSVDANAGTL